MLYAAVRVLEEPQPLLGPLTTRQRLGARRRRAARRQRLDPAGDGSAGAVPGALGGSGVGGDWKRRLVPAALAMAATAVGRARLLRPQLVLHRVLRLHARPSGWGFYSRSAPFADCTKFDPPEGTEALCEEKPRTSGFGPDFYGWEPDSPAPAALR